MDAWQRVWSRLSGTTGPDPGESAGPVSLLIVGLGNPGSRYDMTPHNLGFMAVDRLADQEDIRFSWKEANARLGRGTISGHSVLLAKPLSYMNLSGEPVKALLKKYELQPKQLVVVYDELALPWLQLRIRERGSSAGHKGVKSMIEAVGTDELPS